MPVDREFYGIARQNRRGKLDALPRERVRVPRPSCWLPVHRKAIYLYSWRQVQRVGAAHAWSTRLVNVEKQLEHELPQRIRAVVHVADLLRAAHVAVGRHCSQCNRIARVIFPIIAAGPAVRRSRSLVECLPHRSRHVQRRREWAEGCVKVPERLPKVELRGSRRARPPRTEQDVPCSFINRGSARSAGNVSGIYCRAFGPALGSGWERRLQ